MDVSGTCWRGFEDSARLVHSSLGFEYDFHLLLVVC